jgi:hypothetical protein
VCAERATENPREILDDGPHTASVIPAQAGIQLWLETHGWIPAFAGMTSA